MRNTSLLAAFAAFFMSAPICAQTIYPLDRADILAGAKFDFKVEFPELIQAADIKVTINGTDQTAAFGKPRTTSRRKTARISPRYCCAT